jgi:hypothetical protein
MKTILRLFSQVGVNSDSSAPDPSAGLDVKFSNKGLLIPRVSLTSTTSNAPIGGGIVTSLLIYNTANTSDVTSGYYYWNGTSWIRFVTEGFTHYVGELYAGGIVVAVWKETGIEKGLIASLADISSGAAWSNIPSPPEIGPGAQSRTDGQANTNAIIAQDADPTIAAQLCANYTNDNTGTGIYTDWYLPAAWELNQCYNAAFVVNTILGATNGFQSNLAIYWSSTELDINSAWNQIFDYGVPSDNSKYQVYRVRAVRRLSLLNIGQSYGGGIIFYVDGTGQHGLIAAPSDQSSGVWGCAETSIATSTAIGTGQANTTAIVNGCTDTGIAAKICNDLDLNGYNDWFLPSKDELNQMYLHKAAIGGFADYGYWSSSEFSADNAWLQGFGDGSQPNISKSSTFNVRAVRAF